MNLTDHIILDPKDPYETNYIGGGSLIETLRMVVNLSWCDETATGKCIMLKLLYSI
jgi:hypothetical protein